MPPKRTTTTTTTATNRKSSGSSGARKKSTAHTADLGLTAQEEAEIREAWDIFASAAAEEEGDDEFLETGEYIRRHDVRKVLIALGLESSREELKDILETLDPDQEGLVDWERFLEVAALKLQHRDTKEEVEKAYKLFTGGGDGPIRLQDLRRIAEELKEDVTDEQLRDMLEEASSGPLGRGVGLRDFEAVMKKAGVF